ncbi:hypothetical protein SARC_03861 [Sphaeroforma arctica JP610]|uniref:PDZ domain-containing protein n=1 Tax=Sphaeroforma arctica JP610 TaxID=667725 RepID=A0A0L0G467_9EUKA|nr:hypothetical protein SARC_03861 [Sphaeroforma arctica JP610]KNC83902.1 hypothetical protein SARC_03861 [Sphaeroforma arctica JP610]|eukprot:XP_014157804.1 hypothetical protein SARC_03861 [Sphaeroforma arctica JP610]
MMIHISQVSKNNVPLYEEVKPVRRYLKFKKRKGAVLGASLCKINRRFYITDVRDNSLAWRLGLDHGDRMDEINDKPMSSLGPLDFLELFRNVEAVELLVCSRPLELKIVLQETLSPKAIHRADHPVRSQSFANPRSTQVFSGSNSMEGVFAHEHQPRRKGTSVPHLSFRGSESDVCGSSVVSREASVLANRNTICREVHSRRSESTTSHEWQGPIMSDPLNISDLPPAYNSQENAHARSIRHGGSVAKARNKHYRLPRRGTDDCITSGSYSNAHDEDSSSTHQTVHNAVNSEVVTNADQYNNAGVASNVGFRLNNANDTSVHPIPNSVEGFEPAGTAGSRNTGHPESSRIVNQCFIKGGRTRRSDQQPQLPTRVQTRSKRHLQIEQPAHTQLCSGEDRMIHPRAMSDQFTYQAYPGADTESAQVHSHTPNSISWWQGCFNWLVCKSVIMEPISDESEPLLSECARRVDRSNPVTGTHVCTNQCVLSSSQSDGEDVVVHVQERSVNSGTLKFEARKYHDENADSFNTLDEEEQEVSPFPPPLPTPRLGLIYINGQVVEVEEVLANDCKARPCAPPRTGDVIHEVDEKDMLGKTDAHIMLEMSIAMIKNKKVEIRFFPPVLAQEIAVARLTRKR